MAEAAQSGLAEMRGFVTGLERDLATVKAALTSEWSNGQVEGQVNKLKARQLRPAAPAGVARRLNIERSRLSENKARFNGASSNVRVNHWFRAC